MLAARGTRDDDSGEQPVEDEAEREALRAKGRGMWFHILLSTSIFTVGSVLIPA